MLNKLLKWAANKRGFNLEPSNRLQHMVKAKGAISVSNLMYREVDGTTCTLHRLERRVICPGDTLKIYITD